MFNAVFSSLSAGIAVSDELDQVDISDTLIFQKHMELLTGN